MSRCRRNAGATFSSLKNRRKVLAPPFDARLKEIIAEVVSEAEMTLHAVEADPTLIAARKGI